MTTDHGWCDACSRGNLEACQDEQASKKGWELELDWDLSQNAVYRRVVMCQRLLFLAYEDSAISLC